MTLRTRFIYIVLVIPLVFDNGHRMCTVYGSVMCVGEYTDPGAFCYIDRCLMTRMTPIQILTLRHCFAGVTRLVLNAWKQHSKRKTN